MSLVESERTKLTATCLNGVAIAIFAIGALAPLVSFAGEDSQAGRSLPMLVAVGCVVFSFALHLIARFFLGRLRE